MHYNYIEARNLRCHYTLCSQCRTVHFNYVRMAVKFTSTIDAASRNHHWREEIGAIITGAKRSGLDKNRLQLNSFMMTLNSAGGCLIQL